MNIMKKTLEFLIEIKQRVISFVKVQIFLLSTEKRQHYLIMKNASMFLGMQNFAKKYNNDGDLRSSILIRSEHYDYLDDFMLYCDAKGLDTVKWLEMFSV
jgi:hypothetical protein